MASMGASMVARWFVAFSLTQFYIPAALALQAEIDPSTNN
jgi:hypothetical protein